MVLHFVLWCFSFDHVTFLADLAELIEKFVLHLSESPSDCYFSGTEYEGNVFLLFFSDWY